MTAAAYSYPAIIVSARARRVKRMEITAEAVLAMFRDMNGLGARRLRCEGIPSDARCVGVTTSNHFNTATLWLESSEFPEVDTVSEEVPFLKPTFTLEEAPSAHC